MQNTGEPPLALTDLFAFFWGCVMAENSGIEWTHNDHTDRMDTKERSILWEADSVLKSLRRRNLGSL